MWWVVVVSALREGRETAGCKRSEKIERQIIETHLELTGCKGRKPCELRKCSLAHMG